MDKSEGIKILKKRQTSHSRQKYSSVSLSTVQLKSKSGHEIDWPAFWNRSTEQALTKFYTHRGGTCMQESFYGAHLGWCSTKLFLESVPDKH